MITMSHHQDITDLLRRRNAANIPIDQRALLENDNSWATDLKGSVYGQAHVPGHVLETVKQAYVLAQETSCRRRQSRQSSANASVNGRANSQPYQNESPKAVSQHQESSPPPQTQEQSIDWSQSPERPQRSIQSQPTTESSLVQETPQAKVTIPPPKLASRPVFAPISEFPSSDMEQEELEMEMPQAAVMASSAVNLASAARRRPALSSPLKANSIQATYTPPCAQPTQPPVPSSSAAKKPVEEANPKTVGPRPYRRMKPILMSDASPVPTRLNRATSSFARLPAMKIYEEIESSNSTSSGSYIPSTHLDAPAQKPTSSPGPVHRLPPDTQAETVVHESPAAGKPTNKESDNDNNNDNDNDNNNDASDNVRSRSSSEELVVEHIMPSIETVEEEATDPYTLFTAVYPAYTAEHNGSLRNFVKACVCLEFLRNERALRECLYDDFIRAFSGGYLSYVNNAGPHQEPLPAIEWFNNLQGSSAFNNMAVTRGNLDSILESYPGEVARSRQMIEVDDESVAHQSSPHLSTPGLDGAMDVDKPELAPPPVPTPAARHDVPEVASPSLSRGAALSQPPPSRSLQLEPASTMSPSPSASEVRQQPSRRTSPSAQRYSRLVHYPSPKPAASVVGRQPSHRPSESVQREPTLVQHPSPKPVAPVVRRQPSHRPAESVRPGSRSAHSPSSNPASSAVMPQPPPRSSQYFEKLSATSRPGTKIVKRRSAAEQARLREYFRKRKSSGSRSVPSSTAGGLKDLT